MKHIRPASSLLRAAAGLMLLSAFTAPSLAGWASSRMENKQEIFAYADKNGDRNIDSSEREQLDAAFAVRSDLKALDINQNGKLDREEVDALEQACKPSNTEKRKEKKKQERDKKLEKKFKKNR